jgi:hypothetical protein
MDIKRTIRLLSPLLVQGTLAVRQNSNERLVEKLDELEFSTRTISKSNDNVIEIELQILDVNLLYRLLAGEANKFLLASRVSFERSTQKQPRNASWQVIENYYAAYFAVHYLLRLTGVSLTNLDSNSIACIERSNYGSKPQFQISSGLYIMVYDDQTQTLKLTKKPKTGGSHQNAWQLWEELIDKISRQANADLVEYAATSIYLAEHKQFLVGSTLKYNPPEIRAEINYQFRGGVWVFEKDSSKSIGVLQRLLSVKDVSNSSNIASNPVGLISTNRFIICLAKAVFLHASERYPKGVCRSILNKYKAYVW